MFLVDPFKELVSETDRDNDHSRERRRGPDFVLRRQAEAGPRILR
jgi:hypothetical protein